MRYNYTKYILSFAMLIAFITNPSFGQQIRLSGSVMDKELTVLPYTHVYTSSQKGTYADIDANFYLNVQLGDTVNFSSIGYELATHVITDSTKSQKVTILLNKKSIVLEDIVVRDYYQANTIIKKSEGERMKVPGVNYAPSTPEAEKYHLGVLGSAMSPATAIYRVASKKYKEEKRYYEERIVREKEDADYVKAKKGLSEALDALGEDLDEYYYREFMDFVGLSTRSIGTRTTYDLVLIIREPLVRFKKKLFDEGRY